jgi:hypothetical protein
MRSARAVAAAVAAMLRQEPLDLAPACEVADLVDEQPAAASRRAGLRPTDRVTSVVATRDRTPRPRRRPAMWPPTCSPRSGKAEDRMERIATVSARLALSSMLLVASSSCAGPEDGPVVEETSAAVSSAAYGGGAVLSNVHVVPVMWTLYVNPAEIVLFRGFYKHVVASRYFDWLTEYRTPAQDIGRGSAEDVIYAFPAATDSLLDRPAIEAELALEIDGDHLPRPEANTLYMVHLPPGVAFQYGSQR